MHQTRRRTQVGLTPGKDHNDLWHQSERKAMEWCYLRIALNQNPEESTGTDKQEVWR